MGKISSGSDGLGSERVFKTLLIHEEL
jgi:hypothetical protein